MPSTYSPASNLRHRIFLLAQKVRVLAVIPLGMVGLIIFYHYMNPIYPIREWLAWPLLTLWGWVLLAELSWLSLGYFLIVRVLGIRDLPLLEQLVMSVAIGLISFTELMYLAGAAGLYGALFSVLLSASLIVLGAKELHQLGSRLLYAHRNSKPWTFLQIGLWSMGAILTAILYFGAMTPDSVNYDAAWSHLTVAQDYARSGKIVPFPADYNKNVPQLASIIHTWGFSVPGLIPPLRWMLALHQEFGIFLWTLAGVAAATRFLLKDERIQGAWVAFYLFPIIFVYDHNLGGAADHFAAVFLLPGVMAAGRLTKDISWQRGMMVILCMAGGMLTKYQAFYWVLPLLLYVGFHWGVFVIHTMPASSYPGNQSRILLWLLPVIWGAALVVLVSPHFLKNYIFFNNPTYPLFQDIFTNTQPTVKDAPFLFSHIFTDLNYAPQGTTIEKLNHAFKLLFTFSFEPHYSFTKNVPVFGSLFTLLLPALFLIREWRGVLVGAYTSLAALFLWSITFNVDRNLQVILPIVVATTGALIIGLFRLGWLARIAIIPLLCLQIIWGADAVVYSSYDRLQSSISLIRSGFEGSAKTRFDGYRSQFRALHEAIPVDAKVLLHNAHLNLGIDRELLLDWTGFQGMISYAHIRNPQELLTYYRQLGITHVVYIPGSHPASSLQEEVIFYALVSRFDPLITSVAGYKVFPLPDPSAWVEPAYQVAVLGMEGYGTGIFPIEKLGTIRQLIPSTLRIYAAREASVPNERSGLEKANLDAFVLGVTPGWTSVQKDYVDEHFRRVIEFPGQYSVYVKKT